MIITAKVKGVKGRQKFFNVADLMRDVEEAKQENLKSIGFFVRNIIMKSMRKTKRAVSKPGQPPRAHQGDLRRGIIFKVGKDDVTIGALKYNKIFWNDFGKPTKGTVPEILEFGGKINTIEIRKSKNGKWRRLDMRQKRNIVSMTKTEVVMRVKRKVRGRGGHYKFVNVTYPIRMKKSKIRKRSYLRAGLKKAESRKKYANFFKLLGPVSIK